MAQQVRAVALRHVAAVLARAALLGEAARADATPLPLPARLRRDDAFVGPRRAVRVLGRGRFAVFLALGFLGGAGFLGAFGLYGLYKFSKASSAAARSWRRASFASKSTASTTAFAATSKAFDASTSFCAMAASSPSAFAEATDA